MGGVSATVVTRLALMLVSTVLVVGGCEGASASRGAVALWVYPETEILHLDETLRLFAEAYYERASEMHAEDVTFRASWESSDPRVATVDNFGLARPVVRGEPLPVGGHLQFQAACTNALGTPDETEEVAWTSSDETIATIDAAGLATGVAAGTTTISATHVDSGGYAITSNELELTVTP
jgi:uncharacterized protein YjdB